LADEVMVKRPIDEGKPPTPEPVALAEAAIVIFTSGAYVLAPLT
jgi:hypothetical protein